VSEKATSMPDFRSSIVMGSDFGGKQLLKHISARIDTLTNEYIKMDSDFWATLCNVKA
jgi:hypothetical protein